MKKFEASKTVRKNEECGSRCTTGKKGSFAFDEEEQVQACGRTQAFLYYSYRQVVLVHEGPNITIPS